MPFRKGATATVRTLVPRQRGEKRDTRSITLWYRQVTMGTLYDIE